MNVLEFRQQHPEYSDIADNDLAVKLHDKYYSDISQDEFNSKFLSSDTATTTPTTKNVPAVPQIYPSEDASGTLVGKAMTGTAEKPIPGEKPIDLTNIEIPDQIKQALIPTIAEVLASVLLRGQKVPVRMIGEAVSSGAGEAVQQKLGITEPSKTQIGISAAGPVVGRGVGQAIESGIKNLPGAKVAKQEMAVQTAEGLSGQIKPTQDVDQLYAAVAQHNPYIDVAGIRPALNKLLENEAKIEAIAPELKSAAVEKLSSQLLESTQYGVVPFQNLLPVLKRVGQRIDSLRGSDSAKSRELLGAYKKVYGEIQQSLDKAAASTTGGPAIAALREANAAAKRQFASNDLAEWVRAATNPAQQGTGFRSINVKSIIKNLEDPDNELFRKAITPKELGEIRKTLDALAKVKTLPPEGQHGLGMRGGRAMLTGAIAYFSGIDPATATALGGLIGGGDILISKALMTKPGRDLLLHLLKKDNVLDFPRMATLGAFLATQTAEKGETPEWFSKQVVTPKGQKKPVEIR